MKKLLVVLLVVFGLQTQAQINICDSVAVIGFSHDQSILTIQSTGINTFIDWWVTGAPQGTCPNILQEDSMTNVHTVYNYNPNTGLPYDTLTTCITYMQTTCCIEWVWIDTIYGWQRVGFIQQINLCDSLSYSIDHSALYPLSIFGSPSATNPISGIDAIDWDWTVCTMFPSTGGGMCYSASGAVAFFNPNQITFDDTIKINYMATIYSNNYLDTTYCNGDDVYMIFDGWNWVLYNINNTTTSINELTFNKVNDNKIYDLLGREVTKLQTGIVYIRNGKKYILSE